MGAAKKLLFFRLLILGLRFAGKENLDAFPEDPHGQSSARDRGQQKLDEITAGARIDVTVRPRCNKQEYHQRQADFFIHDSLVLIMAYVSILPRITAKINSHKV
jgi:hypothetical protein